MASGCRGYEKEKKKLRKAINCYESLSHTLIHTDTVQSIKMWIHSHPWHLINHPAGSVSVWGSADVHRTVRKPWLRQSAGSYCPIKYNITHTLTDTHTLQHKARCATTTVCKPVIRTISLGKNKDEWAASRRWCRLRLNIFICGCIVRCRTKHGGLTTCYVGTEELCIAQANLTLM